MAQHDFNIANATFPSVRSDINSVLEAINTSNSGTSRPSSAVAGTIWLDTTSATTPTLKFYDGTDDISLATIDYTANTVNWLDSSVTLTSPVEISGNSTAGAEIRLPEDTDNGSHYVALKAPDTLASNLTFTLPNANGVSGQALVTNGSGVLSFASAGLAWQSTIVTGTTLTAVAGNGYWINTTSNACTITLPASASVGDQIILVDYDRTWGTNAVTLNINSLNYQGGTENPVYDTNGQTVNIVYSGATNGWIPTSDDDVVDEGSLPPYSADFLVIAGGGSGASSSNGGGGGAGGYRTSTQTVSGGIVITVTVGDGGASVTLSSDGNTGSNSSISGSGLTTITSAGGGGGGGGGGAGLNGGSGGGGGNSGGAGSGNTPSTSPSQGNNGGTGSGSAPALGAGGGGGASAVGQAGSSSKGGDGGAGTASSITGSSVTRAGGGGGATNTTIGSGGAGGGGDAGTHPSGDGGAGTVNTGSGGGGGEGAGGISGAGGKGVVILSMPDANYSGTTTGSPTVATGVSGKTVLTFTGTGSYTA